MIPTDYGSYRLPPWRKRLLDFAQHREPGWFGRRLALLARRLVLKGRTLPIDAEAEGFRLRVHVTDNVSERKYLFMPQFVDPAERGYMVRHLTQDGVFLDIGANAGIYTLTAARNYAQAGGHGYVLAVEANPIMQARLRYNIAINGFDPQVRLAPIALSDQTGEVEFSIAEGNLGESGLISTGGNKLKVPCKTLIDLLHDEGIAHLDGMKIDVEGAEDVILIPFFKQTSPSLFPRFIIIEDSAHRWRSDLLGVLSNAGYRRHTSHRMNMILVRDQS